MKKLVYLGLLLIGCFSFLFLFGQSNVWDLEKRKQDVLVHIEETTKKLDDANKNVAASLQKLNLISQKVAVRKKYIAALNNEISDIEEQIFEVQEDIKDQTNELNREKDRYAQILRGMQKNNYYKNKLLFILSAKSVAQSYRRFEYMREMYSSQKKQLKGINEKQAELFKKEKELDAKRSEKMTLLNIQQAEDLKLFDEEKKQKELVDDLLRKQGALQAELNKQKQQSIDLNNQIEGNITVPDPLATDTKTSPENNKSDIPSVSNEQQSAFGNIEKSKGRLPMPVSGKFLITGRFGEQQYEELKQATVTNGGINIQAISSNDVKSVYDGEVSAVFASAGYHYTVIVRHGDYLTIYSNLSSVSVTKGNRVMSGQSIGKIYVDPNYGDMAVLHFQIRKGKTKLNPEVWLK